MTLAETLDRYRALGKVCGELSEPAASAIRTLNALAAFGKDVDGFRKGVEASDALELTARRDAVRQRLAERDVAMNASDGPDGICYRVVDVQNHTWLCGGQWVEENAEYDTFPNLDAAQIAAVEALEKEKA